MEATYKGAEREKALTETRLTVLNRMIDDLLMEQQSRKAGIVVRDEDVNNAIEDMLKRRNVSREDLRKALERDGITLEAYRKGMRDQLMRIRLVQREIKSKVAVSDEEIGEYYRKHREEYEGKEAVRIKQILLLLPKDAIAGRQGEDSGRKPRRSTGVCWTVSPSIWSPRSIPRGRPRTRAAISAISRRG